MRPLIAGNWKMHGLRADLQKIVTQSKADDYRLASLVETFITSDLFQKR